MTLLKQSMDKLVKTSSLSFCLMNIFLKIVGFVLKVYIFNSSAFHQSFEQGPILTWPATFLLTIFKYDNTKHFTFTSDLLSQHRFYDEYQPSKNYFCAQILL